MKQGLLILAGLMSAAALTSGAADKRAPKTTGEVSESVADTVTGAITDSAATATSDSEAAAKTDSVTVAATDSAAIPMTDSLLLAVENQRLTEALLTAIPFAEAGIIGDRSCINASFDKIDSEAIEAKIAAIAPLEAYSEKIAAHSDTLSRFMELARTYAECADFDRKPYSKEYVDDVQAKLIDIYSEGNGILNRTQQDQINSLYEWTNAYADAVDAFDGIIREIDESIAPVRDNKDGDKLCANEIGRVLEASDDARSRIADYRYLASLLSRFEKELKASPRSMTPQIREELDHMLGRGTNAETADEQPSEQIED